METGSGDRKRRQPQRKAAAVEVAVHRSAEGRASTQKAGAAEDFRVHLPCVKASPWRMDQKRWRMPAIITWCLSPAAGVRLPIA